MNQSGITDANGARLYFETAGSGEALVFIHGRGLDARMWDPQFEVFAQRFSVIRYDMRGFGRSSVPTAEGYSHAEDLYALLLFLRVQQAHIVGLSLGGRHAVNFGLLYPEVTKSLISLFKETYESTIQISRAFDKDLREFRYLRLMRASVSSTREADEARVPPEQQTGPSECRQSGGALITSSPRHPWLSTPPLADLL